MSKNARTLKAITTNLNTMDLRQICKAISKVVSILHTGGKADKYAAKKTLGVLNARLNEVR